MLRIANTDTGDGESHAGADAFLTENAEIRFKGEGRKEIYAWADQLLKQQNDTQLAKAGKGLVRLAGENDWLESRTNDTAGRRLQGDRCGEVST